MTPGPWVVVVPAKSFAAAKTRCVGLAATDRAALARAMLTDVLGGLTRARRVRAVVVATTDPQVTATALACGAVVAGRVGPPDLNAEVQAALRLAGEAYGDARLAVVMADLAAARPAEFDAALAAAGAYPRAVVSDADGTGTTLLALTEAADFRPYLGPGSRRRFLADGYHDLPVLAPGLRRDVDTVAHLLDLRVGDLGAGTRAWAATPPSVGPPVGTRPVRRAHPHGIRHPA
ncbi:MULTISPECIES: 2-phospho-L-lactate guanylyltransferase [unclassified Micromonospora]|uniref:2-phospho-L-lactate guanylyltransferase n=1 Tax=unclassified Micromonospora TaxID=2617518 RepID=UPI0010345709|nr:MULTISPECIES: 2-phospho-L-lactate guanylyltransferase [unclassified Micromonospora]QKW13930.1 2-phospho-L-lactate guanylyltransferase [Verrucosispora sp. NA02020]TBL36423.1 2-phospho-L-lactate guanylyltransferase [Verrucosispora sp. SN26_14.1]